LFRETIVKDWVDYASKLYSILKSKEEGLENILPEPTTDTSKDTAYGRLLGLTF
jgi:hypothetical protein